MKRLICVILAYPLLLNAQAPYQPGASEIKNELHKLNFLGSVLYVAAHPDDENTRAIAYLSKGKLATTAYLAMTRGDGGQNLVGPEIRDLLGLIRTQELLAARRLDGGQQFFTRANDFGYSKSAEEALRIWGKDEILYDVVKVFRQYQPDVILTRFPPTSQAGHGHHTASAMLAIEAFDVAAQPSAYPDQVKTFGTWQPKRLYINTGRWWNNTIDENTQGVLTFNVGGYNPLLGKSYTEIASLSRSQHKSQGFGSSGARGDQTEFLEFVKGKEADDDIFDGVNTTWTRLKGGEAVQRLVTQVIKEFDAEHPERSVVTLVKIRSAIEKLESGVWKTRKLADVTNLIQASLGLYLEAKANNFWTAPGEEVTMTYELINRSPVEIKVVSISVPGVNFDSTLNVSLADNVGVTFKSTHPISKSHDYSDPYWLRDEHSPGIFSVKDKSLIGKPENDPAVTVTFTLQIGNDEFKVDKPLIYKWTDRVKGELYRPFEVVPPVFVNMQNSVLIFATDQPRDVSVIVRSASQKSLEGNVKLSLPSGWRSEPAQQAFSLKRAEEEVVQTFKVYPSRGESTGKLRAVATVGGENYDYAIQTISYDHIPTQTLLPRSEASLARIGLKIEGQVIGYISGAGDDIPEALRNMGYEVWEMKNEEVTPENLKRLDAVVLGVRALNTNERISYMIDDLMNYVEDGGTMVVQYNTSFGLQTNKFSPYPLSISRDRVTEEDAEVRILAADHPILNYPNKIEPKDFEGWVQERGLYFPNKWDQQYVPLLSMNDMEEDPMDGSLLVAKYGDGQYIYTGLSFFRELPEGVIGAYKLFANMVSQSSKKPSSVKVKQKSK